MPTQRYYAATWPNPDHSTTAMLLDIWEHDEHWPTAIAETPSEALGQLRDLLQWRAKRAGWLEPSDLTDPQTLTIRVDVRPSHPLDDRAVTFPNTVALPVVCVFGERDEETRACFIPSLELLFDYTRDDLK